MDGSLIFSKKNMHDDQNGNGAKSPKAMSELDMLAELMSLMSRKGISDYKLCKILAYVERVVS